MKRVFALAVVVAVCAIIAASVSAVPQHERISTKTMLVDRNNDGKIDGIDVYDQDGKIMQRGYDTNGDTVIDKWQPTDVNTGLPVVTESDNAYNLGS
jgi:hypothetical protein